MRCCVFCGREAPKKDLIRIVMGPDNASLDTSGREKGRGAYLCRRESCIRGAVEKGLLDETLGKSCLDSLEDYRFGILSIAAAAGKICSGEFQTEEAITRGKACFVIIAGDASENTKKKFSDKCRYRGIPFVEYGTKESLGHRIGKEERSTAACLDPGLAAQLVDRFELEVDG